MTTKTARRERILIVDDNRDFAENLAEIFEAEGLESNLAVTASEGVRMAAERPQPDVVLLDLRLPDGDGSRSIPAIQRHAPATPVIVLTGHASLETAIAALNSGAYAYLIKDAPIGEVLSVVRRAVELRRLRLAKRTLKRSLSLGRRLTEAVVRDVAAAIVAVRVDGRIVQWNRGMEVLTGIAAGDVPDLLAWERAASGRAGHAELMASLAPDRRRGSGEPSGVEIALAHESGERRFAEAIVSTVSGASGKPWLRLATIHDVTERKAMERRLLRTERLAALGEVSASVAHEVRSPLAAIRSALEVIRDDPELPRGRREVMNEVVAQVDRLASTASDLLSFAKPVDLHVVACSFADIAASAREDLARDPHSASARLEVRDASEGLLLAVDPSRLLLALRNLLLNAVQATDGKGRIVLAARPDGPKSVLLTVEDDGPGLPAAIRERLFEPFVTTRHRGTGLGLAIARKIVEAHGGTIRASDASPHGARFELRIPVGGGRR